MKITATLFLKYLLFLIIGLLLFYWAFKEQDLRKMLSDLKNADLGWIFLATMAVLLAHVIRAFRWNLMISSLGYGNSPLLPTFYAVMIGYLANLAFPRMGEVMRCSILSRSSKIPLMKLVGTVLAERLVDLLLLALVFVLALTIEHELLMDFLRKHVLQNLNVKIEDLTLPIVVLIGLLLILFFTIYFLNTKNSKISKRIIQFINGMKSGILSVRNIDNKLGFFISSITIWILYGVSIYCCFFALKSTSSLGMAAALSTLVFGSLAMIAPVQGGIGAFHWMVSEGLLLYGLSKTEGLAYALVLHTSQTLIILLIGTLSVILIFRHSTKFKNNE